MSTSDVLRAYRRERLPFARFVPISLGLGAMSLVGSDIAFSASVALWLSASMAALLLVAQFRLWDDLADREVDRLLHPTRVLTSNISVSVFRRSLVVLGVLNTSLLATHGDWVPRLIVFGVLCAGFALWYGVHRRAVSTPATIAEAHVVLLKYPLFVYLTTPLVSETWMPRLMAMLAVFVAASAYEILHDMS